MLSPWVLLFANNSWLYSKPTGIDRWVYSGFHVHLHELLSRFPGTYYAARAPWNLFGWAVHQLLPVEPALYVIHFFVFYLAIFSLYVAALTLFSDRLAAFAVAILYGVQRSFLIAAGWDYVDGAFTACLLLSFAALTRTALGPRWKAASFIWGSAMALVVSLYVPLVVFIPVEIGMFLLLNHLEQRRRFLPIASVFTAGGLITVALTGFFNYVAGGPLLYFAAQFGAIGGVAHIQGRYYFDPGYWLSRASWLFAPSIAAVLGIIYTIRSETPRLRAVALACLGATLIYCALQLAKFPVFQYEHTSNPLIATDFLLVGGALALITRRIPLQLHGIGYIACFVITFLPWWLSRYGIMLPDPVLLEGFGIEAATVLVAVLLTLFSPRLAAFGFVATLCYYSAVSFLTQNTRLMAFPENPAYREGTLAVFDAALGLG
ncbi:MAG: hypothetical protein ACRENA_16435, partial [Vulcanimicrobiaceae bacterium]